MSALGRLSEHPLLFQIVFVLTVITKVGVMPVLYIGKRL